MCINFVFVTFTEMKAGNEKKKKYWKSQGNLLVRKCVFTKENMDNIPTICGSRIEDDLTDYEVKVEGVRKKLAALNPNKSPGPDNIHPCVLKELSEVLNKPLAILYQNSRKMGKIPNDWKHAKVTAIFKKGEREKTKQLQASELNMYSM